MTLNHHQLWFEKVLDSVFKPMHATHRLEAFLTCPAGGFRNWYSHLKGFSHSSAGKESACNAGHPGLIPGSGRSPGQGIDYPLQYSFPEGKGYTLQYSGLFGPQGCRVRHN